MQFLCVSLLFSSFCVATDADNLESARALRKTRWMIVMPKDNPAQLLKKMTELQAFLLIPQKQGGEIYLICDNLNQEPKVFRPIERTAVNSFNRLWFISKDENGRREVAQALQLEFTPAWYALFIPTDLEKELLTKETAHQGLTEEQLHAKRMVTMFEVERQGETWNVKVLYQGIKKQ